MYFTSASPMESQSWHFHNSEQSKGKRYSVYLHASMTHLQTEPHADLHLAPKATSASQNKVVSEPLKLGTVYGKPVTQTGSWGSQEYTLQTGIQLTQLPSSVPCESQFSGKGINKMKQNKQWSNRRQLVLSKYLHASMVPNWLPMS